MKIEIDKSVESELFTAVEGYKDDVYTFDDVKNIIFVAVARLLNEKNKSCEGCRHLRDDGKGNYACFRIDDFFPEEMDSIYHKCGEYDAITQ